MLLQPFRKVGQPCVFRVQCLVKWSLGKIAPHPSAVSRPSALPLVTLFLLPWPVRSLKQLLLSTEEDSGAGPPRDGDGVPGGGAPGPVHTQEIEENLLSLEVAVRQLEVCLGPGPGAGAGCGRKGILHL